MENVGSHRQLFIQNYLQKVSQTVTVMLFKIKGSGGRSVPLNMTVLVPHKRGRKYNKCKATTADFSRGGGTTTMGESHLIKFPDCGERGVLLSTFHRW